MTTSLQAGMGFNSLLQITAVYKIEHVVVVGVEQSRGRLSRGCMECEGAARRHGVRLAVLGTGGRSNHGKTMLILLHRGGPSLVFNWGLATISFQRVPPISRVSWPEGLLAKILNNGFA
jgi:hypothetical protein